MGWDIEDIERQRRAFLRSSYDFFAQSLRVAEFIVHVRLGFGEIGNDEGRSAYGAYDARYDSLSSIEMLIYLKGAKTICVADSFKSVIGILQVPPLGERHDHKDFCWRDHAFGEGDDFLCKIRNCLGFEVGEEAVERPKFFLRQTGCVFSFKIRQL